MQVFRIENRQRGKKYLWYILSGVEYICIYIEYVFPIVETLKSTRDGVPFNQEREFAFSETCL